MSAQFLPVVGAAITAMLLAVSLRDMKREYAVLLSLGCGALLLFWSMETLAPVAERLTELIELTGMDEQYSQIMLKALGISVCAQLGSDACRDAGESAIGSKVELCGRVCVLALSLPLLGELLNIAGEIISA